MRGHSCSITAVLLPPIICQASPYPCKKRSYDDEGEDSLEDGGEDILVVTQTRVEEGSG